MKQIDFEHAVKLGLGRAIVHLRANDPTPYYSIILNACLHNTTYDPQVEGYKTTYLLELITLSGAYGEYRQKILEQAINTDDAHDDRDSEQLIALTTALASNGDQEARAVIYNLFTKSLLSDPRGISEIVEIDGQVGFEFVMGQLDYNLNQHRENIDLAIWELEEAIGNSAAQNVLQAYSKTNVDFAEHLKFREQVLALRKSKRNMQQAEHLPYPAIKQKIQDNIPISPTSLRVWAQNASRTELLQAGEDLICESNREKLLLYLSIFQRLPFPLAPQPLIKLFKCWEDDWLITARILNVLRNITHPNIRAFALELIEHNRFVGHAIGLLSNNFEASDWALIDEVIGRNYDEDTLHSIQFNIIKGFSQHFSQRALPVYTALYEYGPCMNCRRTLIEQLLSNNALPDWMRQECHYDANLEIRKLV